MREYEYIQQNIKKWEQTHPEPQDPGVLEYLGVTTYKVIPAIGLDRVWLEVTDDSERHYYSDHDPKRGELQICIRVNQEDDGRDHLTTEAVTLHLDEAKTLLDELSDAVKYLETLVLRHQTHLTSKALYDKHRREYVESRNAEWARLSQEWEAMQSKQKERVFDDEEPQYKDDDNA